MDISFDIYNGRVNHALLMNIVFTVMYLVEFSNTPLVQKLHEPVPALLTCLLTLKLGGLNCFAILLNQ
jgi:hypothetical protein